MKKHLVALLSMMGLATTVAPLHAQVVKGTDEKSNAKTEGKIKSQKQSAEMNAAAVQATQKNSVKYHKADSEMKIVKSDQEIKGEKTAATIKGEKNAAAIKGEKTNAMIKGEKSNAIIKGEKTSAEVKAGKSEATVKMKNQKGNLQENPK